MGIVTVYVLYLLISVVLTIVTATILARSGKTFLSRVFGGDEALGQALSRLFVVGFYLLNLGFVILAMRTSTAVHDTRQAMDLLSVKLGEALLIIGGLHLINVLVLTRVSRRVGGRSPVEWRPARRGSISGQ
jgi:cytochrome c biogenesis protein CcdA